MNKLLPTLALCLLCGCEKEPDRLTIQPAKPDPPYHIGINWTNAAPLEARFYDTEATPLEWWSTNARTNEAGTVWLRLRAAPESHEFPILKLRGPYLQVGNSAVIRTTDAQWRLLTNAYSEFLQYPDDITFFHDDTNLIHLMEVLETQDHE